MSLDQASVDFLTVMKSNGAKPLHKMSISEIRSIPSLPKDAFGQIPNMHNEYIIKLPVDGAEIDLHIIKPQENTQGVLVYYHGGGWVMGDASNAMFQVTCKHLAIKTNLTFVLVNYRKAPENLFPAAIEDSYAALRWVHDNIIKLSGSKAPILVGGDSAGGNISAVVAQKARDEKGPSILLQLLVYPVTGSDFKYSSYLDPKCQTALFSSKDMKFFWDHYLPDIEERKNPYASPLYAETFEGLPPAILITAGHDPLRDEGEDYASRLIKAGVEVIFKRYHDQMHAFLTFPNVLPRSMELIEFISKHINLFLAETNH